MSRCEHFETCIVFNGQMANMPATAAVYRQMYCEDRFDTCARYLVGRGKGWDHVPADLLPNQAERAAKILHN